MAITITPIVQVHATGFHACLDAVARERRYLAQVEAPPLERVLGFVSDSVRNQSAQLVVLDGDQVVGWCDIFPAWPAAQQHCGRLGMGLLSAYRGRGIGHRLLQSCIAMAASQGITRIELDVRADNLRAIKLYERVGFALEARKRQALCFDGVYFDALQMSLLLGSAGS
jgi:putative acetyltransferase